MKRLPLKFFQQDALDLAPALIGQSLVRRFPDGEVKKYLLTETEAYRGEEDLACHAAHGRTARTEIMYASGGRVYVYLIYGLYWLLNLVSGSENQPQAVLIRAVEGISGPGRLGQALGLDKSFYGEDLSQSARLWLEPGPKRPILATPRIGVEYAHGWAAKPWRFLLDSRL